MFRDWVLSDSIQSPKATGRENERRKETKKSKNKTKLMKETGAGGEEGKGQNVQDIYIRQLQSQQNRAIQCEARPPKLNVNEVLLVRRLATIHTIQ
jgi:hypothetical protein